jgi:exodeoxyribonuclease VII small subunit
MAKKAGAEGGGQELPAEIRKMSFEEALKSLEEIVQRLESGEVSLEDSIEIYGRGTLLKRHCEAKLRVAQQRVDKIVVEADGTVASRPADIE